MIRAARRWSLGLAPWLALAACAGAPPDDGRPIPGAADPARRTPRPDQAIASFHFQGDLPDQREFVWLYPDGSYDYAERWDAGVPEDAALQVRLGWDWKTGCRMRVEHLEDGKACCTQACEGGGRSGVGHEPPESFGCMNRSAGGRFDWFLEGLREHCLRGLEACLPES